jgi:hypothetical protein
MPLLCPLLLGCWLLLVSWYLQLEHGGQLAALQVCQCWLEQLLLHLLWRLMPGPVAR